jgi:hypothetical protein
MLRSYLVDRIVWRRAGEINLCHVSFSSVHGNDIVACLIAVDVINCCLWSCILLQFMTGKCL